MGTAEGAGQNIETYPVVVAVTAAPPLRWTLLQKYLEPNAACKDISRVLYCTDSCIAGPNRCSLAETPWKELERGRGGQNVGEEVGITRLLSETLLEISCNFDSRGDQVSRSRKTFRTPARSGDLGRNDSTGNETISPRIDWLIRAYRWLSSGNFISTGTDDRPVNNRRRGFVVSPAAVIVFTTDRKSED